MAASPHQNQAITLPQEVDVERDDPSLEHQSLLQHDKPRSTTPTFHAGVDLPWYRQPLFITAATNLALILTWYFFGTFLSLWNKILLSKEHGLFGNGAFPAPFMMSSLQFFAQHLIARFLLASKLVARRGEEQLTWKQYLKTIVPNGIATGLDIGFSNYSLVFITLSFYVMCKSTTPLFLLTFAILWGIEKPSWSLAAVVSIIVCGLLLLVAGETQFHLVGFILVMSASALAGLRWTITQVLLQGNKQHASTGGPVEVMFQLTPIMGITLGIISLSFEQLWSVLPDSPYFSSPGHTLVTTLILFTGGIIAFCMVWAEFTLISNTSALTFMVAGTFKEIVTVGAAVLFLHERFTIVNAMGLVVLVVGVVLFNYLKYQKLKHGELRPIPISDSDFGSSSGSSSGSSGGSSGYQYNATMSGDTNNNSNSGNGVYYSQSKNQYGDTLVTFHNSNTTTTTNSSNNTINGSYNGQSSMVEMVSNGTSSIPLSPGSKAAIVSDNIIRKQPMFVLQEDYGSGDEATPGGSARVLMAHSIENEVVLRRQRSM